MVTPIPDGYPAVSPTLIVDGAAAAVEFYKAVFGATERMRIGAPDGKIGHVELIIGTSLVMLSDEYPEMDIVGPRSLGGSPVVLSVYVEDVDATFATAIALGAVARREVADQFYGDRSGYFEDPFGHRWSVATHVEDLSAEEIGRRAAAMAQG